MPGFGKKGDIVTRLGGSGNNPLQNRKNVGVRDSDRGAFQTKKNTNRSGRLSGQSAGKGVGMVAQFLSGVQDTLTGPGGKPCIGARRT